MDSINRDILMLIASSIGTEIFNFLATCTHLHAYRAELTEFVVVEEPSDGPEIRKRVTNFTFRGHMWVRKCGRSRIRCQLPRGGSNVSFELAFSAVCPDKFYPFRHGVWVNTNIPVLVRMITNAFAELLIGGREIRMLAAM
jgi:hypothetical protein